MARDSVSGVSVYPEGGSVGYTSAAPIGGSIKRMFDILGALVGLLCLSTLFLFVSAFIKFADGGPILYRHRRVGQNGLEFDCMKFRTMVVDADAVLSRYLGEDSEAADEWRTRHKLRNDPRVTRLGAVLRKTSIDELPQLINILQGEMSFVGPRPIVAAEVPRYGNCIEKYYRARPGLTGMWQVSGRNDIGYDDRVRLDVQYVEHWSLWRDVMILAKTCRVVLTARGCY